MERNREGKARSNKSHDGKDAHFVFEHRITSRLVCVERPSHQLDSDGCNRPPAKAKKTDLLSSENG